LTVTGLKSGVKENAAGLLLIAIADERGQVCCSCRWVQQQQQQQSSSRAAASSGGSNNTTASPQELVFSRFFFRFCG